MHPSPTRQPHPTPINTPRPHAFQHILDFYHARAGYHAYLGEWAEECRDMERVAELDRATADHHVSGAFAPQVFRVRAPDGTYIPRAETTLGTSGWTGESHL